MVSDELCEAWLDSEAAEELSSAGIVLPEPSREIGITAICPVWVVDACTSFPPVRLAVEIIKLCTLLFPDFLFSKNNI